MTFKTKPLFNFRIKLSKTAKSAILLTTLILAFLIIVASISLLTSKEDYNLQNFEIVNGVLKKYYGTNNAGLQANISCVNENVIIPNGVKEIGSYAFEGCEAMTSITIPDSVKVINEGAFRRTKLKKVNIPRGVEYIDKNAFQYSDSVEIIVSPQNKKYSTKDGVLYNKDMTELIRYYDREDVYYFKIPDGVEKIGNSAFLDCRLTDLYISGSVKEIEDFAFMGDREVLSIKVAEENKNFIVKNNVMFSKDMTELVWYSRENTATSYVIPDGIMTIRAGAFQLCAPLQSITIPDSVKVIGDYAFKNIRGLKSIKIPDSVSEMGESPFLGCFMSSDSEGISVDKNSKYFTLKDGILYNKEMTEILCRFHHNNLTEVTIPNTVKKIRNYAFCHCYNLIEVVIPDSVVEIGEGAFILCRNITSIKLPAKITSIANLTFWGCDSIESINIPDSVESIGDAAFYFGQGMTGIKLPEGIRKIGMEAFSGELKSINIPASTVEIADDAFKNCTGLKEIDVDDRNKVYSSKDGVLFNKDATRLIKYPGGKTDSHYAVPAGVKKIIGNSFSDCKYLISIDVPGSVEVINGNAFSSYDSKIANINVDGDNKIYTSKDGVLFDKEMKALILYPYGRKDKEYLIPEGVTTIRENAFLNCVALLQLTIPESVTTIEKSGLPYRNDQFSIKGHEYSAAHEYATANDIPFVSAEKQ